MCDTGFRRVLLQLCFIYLIQVREIAYLCIGATIQELRGPWCALKVQCALFDQDIQGDSAVEFHYQNHRINYWMSACFVITVESWLLCILLYYYVWERLVKKFVWSFILVQVQTVLFRKSSFLATMCTTFHLSFLRYCAVHMYGVLVLLSAFPL